MAKLFVIGDLHFSQGVEKPMDIFGKAWANHTERLCENWKRVVSEEDYVVVNGDISWGLELGEAVPDLVLLDSLPGTKIIMKGNHELWWTSMAKLTGVLKGNGLTTILPLYNNAYYFTDSRLVICGTRGWLLPGDDDFGAGDAKVLRRELMRFDMSFRHGCELAEKSFDLKEGLRVYFDPHEMIELGGQEAPSPREDSREFTTLAFTHYPPFVFTKRERTDFTDIIEKNNITRCYFGHVHGVSPKGEPGEALAPVYRLNGVSYYLTAADYLRMEPAFICEL